LRERGFSEGRDRYSGKRVIVLGLARSGLSAMELLGEVGAEVIGMDENPAIEIPEKLEGMDIRLGKFDDSTLLHCDEVVLSPGIPVLHSFVQSALERGVPVISELELGFRFCESRIIAVTGTNGKSTTVNMIGAILKTAGINSVTAGNVGLPFTSVVRKLDESSICVLEVSSFQLETITEFHPKVAGILNLTPDHLDRYDTLDSYFSAKLRITENSTTDDIYFYRADDPVLSKHSGTFPGKSIPFSSTVELDTGAYLSGDALIFKQGNEKVTVMKVEELAVKGVHNIENALASISAASTLSVSAEVIRNALRSFKGLPHRMEEIAVIDGVRYINDSKATNVEATIMSLKGMTSPVVLIAGGRDKGGDFTKLSHVADRLKAVITIGEAAPLIEEALHKLVPLARAETMKEAVEMAARTADSGQVVLLSPACASFDMFDNFEHRGDVFRECVMNLEEGRDGRGR